MYVILPGKMSYEESYHFISAAKKMLEEANELLEDENFTKAMEANELTPEQLKAYIHYAKTTERLLKFYIDNGDEPVTEDYGDIFALFAFTLASDDIFHDLVEDYFRTVNNAFTELVKSSEEHNIRVRGAEKLLREYTYASNTVRQLAEMGASDLTVVDSMSDLFVD